LVVTLALDMKNRVLQKLLSRRQFDVSKLADQIFAGRAHVTQVLLGQRRGANTWPKLKRVMTDQEYAAAKKFADGELALREKKGLPDGGFPMEKAGTEPASAMPATREETERLEFS
jgi:hypothetical protein